VKLAALAALLCLAGSSCATYRVLGKTEDGSDIVQIQLKFVNAYLVKSKRPVLIDPGAPFDLYKLKHALKENGVRLEDIALVILTHGHADHAAQGADLQKTYGIKIAAGSGDVGMLADGHNDDLKAQYFSARLIRPLIDFRYDPFKPDVVIPGGEPLDLRPYGIPGRAVQMPGHTPGSVVVTLDDKRVFAGDLMLGGSFGGALSPESPGEHYYQADPDRNRANIRKLLQQGVQTFYLGHGGPVAAADVRKAFGFSN
jgi:hydroxyacylglutathione hydrolase